ncbi:MAG: PSD1 domain-containing protein, partial [Candidatus Saccharimonas sp.]|nr:PSD1 domain-containing protein [Planctomycetaceae bacterium]
RPILSNTCFRCHGPDEKERQAGLRLDRRESAVSKLESGHVAISPGKADASELVRRINSTDPEVMMPPPSLNKPLSEADKRVLKSWVEQGAEYREHWSFVAPTRPARPAVKNAGWPKNEIDYFVLSRLEREGLAPSPEADKITLIRRLTLDLTGLPPIPADVDAFVADASPQAYDKVVDRLLATRHFGERMAVDWLDAARFADTHGFHIDSGRDMTRWREWVIEAFNSNLPFDQFTIQQLAGDLLPEAASPELTLSQRIASGFNRNHMINFEGGAIPAEYHNAYIVDRVNTTGTVWLGLSVACAQCHDHKYDPLTQRDFYSLYAFFHNVPENGLDGSKGNAAPVLKTPTAEQQAKLNELRAAIASLEQQLNASSPDLVEAQRLWEQSARNEKPAEWTVLKPESLRTANGSTLKMLENGTVTATGANPATETYTVVAPVEGTITAVKVELLPDDALPGKGPGRSVNGNVVMTNATIGLGPTDDRRKPRPQKIERASADFSQETFPVANAIDANDRSGWAIHPKVGEPHQAIFELTEPIRLQGQPAPLTITLEFNSQFGQHQPGRFRVSITSSTDPHGKPSLPANITALLTATDRTPAQQQELTKYFREQVQGKKLSETIAARKKEADEVEKTFPTTMVMQEMAAPRDTFILMRGQYDKKGDKVAAATPSFLPPLADGLPPNRLGLAKWLVDERHPLTSRVIVNRYWQMLFGLGLVKTSEDFGSQGEMPSHAELLDWLAVEFRGETRAESRESRAKPDAASDSPSSSGSRLSSLDSRLPWDTKHLIRLLVTSATYRQMSRVTPALIQRDPENRLLARGSRFRLQAEFVRDQALAVSGLLDQRIGGASVSPYQPAGIWEELASRQDGYQWTAQTYKQSSGADLYRRTMYTFWKRTAPPPTLSTFDAPDRETCTVRRARTNTPLQALILLNDPTYVEASRKFAERILKEAGATMDERLTFAFRQVVARAPTERERKLLRQLVEEQLADYRRRADKAEALLKVGESPREARLDPSELAAWTIFASTLLNLDEALTKG